MNKKKNNLLGPILAAFTYTSVMAVGWYFNPYDYGTISNVIYMIPILFILSIMSFVLIKRQRVSLSPGKIKISPLLLLFIGIIVYLAISNFLAFNDGRELGNIKDLSLLLLATLLVGIAEEFTYRGYILNNIEKSRGTRKALLYSSILFGLLHSVNFIAGPSIIATIVQVVLTTAVGYVFGVIYLSTGRNLLLIAMLHGVYDFLVFNMSHLADINNSSRTAALTIPALLAIWLYSIKASKKIPAN